MELLKPQRVSFIKAGFTMKPENRIFTQSSVGARAFGILVMLIPMIVLFVVGIFTSKSEPAIAVLGFVVLLLAIGGFGILIVNYDKKTALPR